MKNKKRALLHSAIALLLCVAMLVGSTYAWFTDGAVSNDNIVQSGGLDIKLHWALDLENGPWVDTENADGEKMFASQLWEPGHTEVRYFRIQNAGDLAFQYALQIVPDGSVSDLAEVIDVYYLEEPTQNIKGRNDLTNLIPVGTLAEVIDGTASAAGVLLPAGADTEDGKYHAGDITVAVALKMQESAGNEYQGMSIGSTFNVVLHAAQYTYEEDAFGSDYDAEAELPFIFPDGTLNESVSDTVNVENGTVQTAATLTNGTVSAEIPAGVKVEGDKLTLTVTDKSSTDSNVTLGENEELRSLDVHVEGVAADNAVPMTITLEEVAPKGLNTGNLKLYHVENGTTVEMTHVETFTAHNQFQYDPATGTVILYMATFSEVVLTSDTVNAWNGTYATSFSGGTGTEDDPYLIANADQLAYFGQAVGGMNGLTQNSFSGEYIKLISDVNLGDAEASNDSDLIFYPIGYYNNTGSYTKTSGGTVTSNVNSFEGTFDGAGHTIANFYQNTWEMFGDYNSGYSGTPNHYKDAMGLFGYVYGGTVKNLTVENFSSDGEFTPTGVIAAYAVNSTFENIALVNCNPRVYNTGNGGIVGIGGNSDDPDTYKLTFTNITIDNTNKITALWGSWDVACGGLVGMFRGAGHVYMTNCHVAAQIDVYNDVCGNYQYYWYRYAGMMVGTNSNMVTDEQGNTVPETEKFHAKGCTVHFGEWNDYYYCELVANSLASYTHDHQFSRLEQISSLDEIKSGDTWSKTGNYLLTSTMECYHIIKAEDGTLERHLHTDAGKETVNGETVDVEDKYVVYLPFNQLFTGYGWGVKHIPVYNGEDYAFEGITVLDRENADSMKKFMLNPDFVSIPDDLTITVGDLFKEIPNVTVNDDSVQVSVSSENGEITGEFVPATEWENGTLKLSGMEGTFTISIQDYQYCDPTILTFENGKLVDTSVDRFKVVLPNTADYLYRVGNLNAVKLESLFTTVEGQAESIGTVIVEIETLDADTDAAGTYTAAVSGAAWDQGAIKFEGTGPVAVTIYDSDNSTPVTLNLEVVDATNVTSYGELGNKNSVLLNDITMSSGGSYYLSGATLYGNGFTFDVTDGAYSGTGSVTNNYLVSLTNAALDNVQIIGSVYTSYGAQVKDNYNRPVVLSVGNNTITNCYISNCAAPVRVRDGNLEIINSTLKGGNFANIDIRSGYVVLDNVTTINQVNGNDTAADGKVVVGLGVVVYYENVLSTTTVEVRNGITQYNNLSETQAADYITDDTAKQLTTVMYNSAYANVQYYDGTDTWVNTGILSMTATVGNDNITDVNGYKDASPSMTGVTGYLHTKVPTADTVGVKSPDYVTTGQGAIPPSHTFDYTKSYVAKSDGSNDYCYEENGIVYISMDAGDTFNWDTSILSVTKNGQTLDYTVSMDGVDYTGKSIPFNTAGYYTVNYTYTDNNNYTVARMVTYPETYTKSVHISVAVIEASAKNAEFTFGSSNQATEKITVGNKSYISATGVSHDNSTWSYITIDGTKIYYPIVEATIVDKKIAYFNVFKNVVTITDYADGGTGAAVTYNSSTTTMPSGLTVEKGTYKAFADISSDWSTLDDTKLTLKGASNVFKYAGSASASATPTTYSGALCFASPEVTNPRDEYITMVQYSYTDATNTTYYYYVGYHMAEKGDGSCVAPDTMITLADGTQVRVDSLTGKEELLVWNLETGKLDSAPIMFVDSDPESEYKIVHLYFSDGTDVKVIYEHGFWDYDLNKYVYLDANAADYIGHTFAKQNGDELSKVKLVNMALETEVTTAWSPVTAGHLCYFVNGMLSMPGGVGGLFNIFDVDPETMTYDYEAMQRDIEKYGLYTYEELNTIEPLSEEMFNAAGGAYLKISIGKGNMTLDELIYMIRRYNKFFE